MLINFKAIIREDQSEDALNYFKLIFDRTEKINEHLDDENLEDEKNKSVLLSNNVLRVIDLNAENIERLINQMSTQLISHDEFKKRFSKSIKNFILLNKIKQKKIFSIFLLGPSGIGKTETARIIKESLNPETTFTKINFGNYSSKESLNNLIGSPRGYIGSDEGELSVKVSKSKAGIILCDEFEKATYPIFNFFLELLEDGVFTDSMSREYDIDGYIIIFTSNMDEKGFNSTIPPELRSRFDLICEFKTLNNDDKQKYVNFYIENFLSNIEVIRSFTEEEKLEFKNVNVNSIDNLRDINRVIRDKILDKVN
jgi:ATP-dependent Clp protease ATP-binding subunit ClpA